MITSNTDAVVKSLEEAKAVIEKKLKAMVSGFATEVVTHATSQTPLGDSEKYIGFYEQRQKDTGLLPEEGVARGAWVLALDGGLTFTPIYGKYTNAEAIAEAEMDAKGYKLGQTFKIGNAAPYIGELEDNYSDQTNGQGIMAPTVDLIQQTYESDLKAYYDKG